MESPVTLSPRAQQDFRQLQASDNNHRVFGDHRGSGGSKVTPDGVEGYIGVDRQPGAGTGSIIIISNEIDPVKQDSTLPSGVTAAHEIAHAADVDSGTLPRVDLNQEDRALENENEARESSGLDTRPYYRMGYD